MLHRYLRPVIVTFFLAASLGLPQAARAFNVVHGGINYRMSIYTGSYDADTNHFPIPSIRNGRMPWWGNPSVAQEFAILVKGNLSFSGAELGPNFAISFDVQQPQEEITSWVLALDPALPSDFNLLIEQKLASNDVQSYAVATAVPAPLPLFASAIVFPACRRLSNLSSRLRAQGSKRQHLADSPRRPPGSPS